MRTYNCQHPTVNSLEKELLFKEVMRLRTIICEAEGLLDKAAEHGEFKDSLKDRIVEFLKDKSK